jgi:RNA polymerase sigma-70 factor (ECF subfamily)
MTAPGRHDDAALVAAARRGDRRAFAELVERHYPRLLRGCVRAAGDPDAAADAAQEAVVAALLGLERLRRADRFGAWLVGIGLNLCRRRLREAARRAAGPVPDLAADGPGPEERAQAAEEAARVRAAVAALPDGQRAAVALFYLGDLDQAEIARRLGTPVGAVKTRLHKARAALRRRLTDEEESAMPVAMKVADVKRTAGEPVRHVVLLEQEGGGARLPIRIGEYEALNLAAVLQEVDLPRPGPYHFAAALVGAAGARLREVRISRLAESIFYARAILDDGGEIDARPSDALTLALVTGAPVLVEAEVLERAALSEAQLSGLVTAALEARDDARMLAHETRARLQATARELAEMEADAPGSEA